MTTDKAMNDDRAKRAKETYREKEWPCCWNCEHRDLVDHCPLMDERINVANGTCGEFEYYREQS